MGRTLSLTRPYFLRTIFATVRAFRLGSKAQRSLSIGTSITMLCQSRDCGPWRPLPAGQSNWLPTRAFITSARSSPRLNGGRSEREAPGMEFTADHGQGHVSAWLNQQKRLLHPLVRVTYYGSLQTQCDSRCSWYSCHQGIRPPVHLTGCPELSSDHATRWTSFQNLWNRPDLMWKVWVEFLTYPEDRLLVNPVVNDEEAIYKWVEQLTSATQEAPAASAPKCRPRSETTPVKDPPTPADISTVNEAMCAYEYAPVSEPTLTKPSEVLEVTEGLSVWRNPRRNGIQNRALRHLHERAITFLTKLFSAVLRRQAPARKQARMVKWRQWCAAFKITVRKERFEE
jgi:hypothetical protein